MNFNGNQESYRESRLQRVVKYLVEKGFARTEEGALYWIVGFAIAVIVGSVVIFYQTSIVSSGKPNVIREFQIVPAVPKY